MEPSISIVTVNWNRKTDLAQLIESLGEQGDMDFEIIVVDNGSSDGSVDDIRTGAPHVRLIALDKNTGVKAFNTGVAAATGRYAVLLDNDVVLPPDFVSKVRQTIDDYSGINVFALNVLDKNGLRQQDYLPQDADGPVMWHNFIGGGVVFRTDYYLRMGGYHDQFFVYINETEFAARILMQNQPILYCPHITLIHKTSPAARIGAAAFFHYVRNGLLFFAMYYPPMERWNLIFGFLMINGKKALRDRLVAPYLKAMGSFIKAAKPYHRGLEKVHRDLLGQCFQGTPALSAIVGRRVWGR
ncbi:MAG: glycosyltransferase family 2 protein [bacterium]|nr:glycosyltransferase family 2 protein [bacterium]